MPTPKKGPSLASSPPHERLKLANMATRLFLHGGLTTTHLSRRGNQGETNANT